MRAEQFEVPDGEVSDRQWGDVRGVLRVQGEVLGGGYLERWAPQLGVAELRSLVRSRRPGGSRALGLAPLGPMPSRATADPAGRSS